MENVAEQRALEGLGFRRERTLRCAEFRDGAWRDVIVYGLLRGELAGGAARRRPVAEPAAVDWPWTAATVADTVAA